MRTRYQRIKDFQTLQAEGKTSFEKIQKRFEDYKTYEDIYGLTICPKGRYGGDSERLFEVFYGNRPYAKEDGFDDTTGKRSFSLLSESGVELYMFRDDFGFVSIQLFPAKAKYAQQFEDSIVLYQHIDPKRLLKPRFQKRLLKYMNAYMAVTSLDGQPTICDKKDVMLLRIFKNMIVNGRVLDTKVRKWSMDILKFVLTIGLSGFLLRIIEKYV